MKNYRDQYNRMIRFYNLLKESYDGIEQKCLSDDGSLLNLPDMEYYGDRVYSFFMNCFHLRDWIVYDSSFLPCETNYGKKCEYIVNNFIKCNDCMKICEDICNGAKHSKITHHKIDQNIGVRSEDWNLRLGQTQRLSMKFEIDCKNQIYDALELANECVNKWNDFIIKHNLSKLGRMQSQSA